MRLITSATQDVDVYEGRTGLNVSEIVAGQKARVIVPTTRKLKRVIVAVSRSHFRCSVHSDIELI